jgi:hypothetical protein
MRHSIASNRLGIQGPFDLDQPTFLNNGLPKSILREYVFWGRKIEFAWINFLVSAKPCWSTILIDQRTDVVLGAGRWKPKRFDR